VFPGAGPGEGIRQRIRTEVCFAFAQISSAIPLGADYQDGRADSLFVNIPLEIGRGNLSRFEFFQGSIR
jgi:hypothetical protein